MNDGLAERAEVVVAAAVAGVVTVRNLPEPAEIAVKWGIRTPTVG